MRHEVTKIVGPEIGNRLDDYWDIDDEGEMRGAYKRMDRKQSLFLFLPDKT